MNKDEFLKTKNENDAKKKIRNHLCQKNISNLLKEIMHETIFLQKEERMMKVEDMKKNVGRIKF